MEGIPVTLWCSLYCKGNEAVGDMDIDFGGGNTVSLPMCQGCADHLQKNPYLLLDLRPIDVVELDNEDGLGKPEQQPSNHVENPVQDG